MKYTRKSFLKTGLLFATVPFLSFLSPCCTTKELITDPSSKQAIDQFSSIMLDQPKYSPSGEFLKLGDTLSIPSSAIITNNIHHIVFRVLKMGTEVKYQGVYLNVLKISDGFAFVTNLESGDVVLTRPKETLTELKKINRDLLTHRFCSFKTLK